MTVVVPPNAAAVVALSKVSALTMPAADSCSMWAWASMPPGNTSLPLASISVAPAARLRPMAAMAPSWMPISASNSSTAVPTRPARMTQSNAACGIWHLFLPGHSGFALD